MDAALPTEFQTIALKQSALCHRIFIVMINLVHITVQNWRSWWPHSRVESRFCA